MLHRPLDAVVDLFINMAVAFEFLSVLDDDNGGQEVNDIETYNNRTKSVSCPEPGYLV